MQVPPEVRHCVGFLYSDLKAEGTAFFLRIAPDDPDWTAEGGWVYAVTAKHVLTELQEEGFQEVSLRVNLRGAGTQAVRTRISDWRIHETAQVAILRWSGVPDADYVPFPMRKQVNDDLIRSFEVGPGDDVFLTGLFVHHPGREKNIPIIRVGNIAAMPDERLVTTNQGEMEGYLIESRSFGGLSGSPVFLNLAGLRRVGGPLMVGATSGFGDLAITTGFWLLGLIYGHYREDARRILSQEDYINMGIAICVPAERIVDLLNSPEEVDMRKKGRSAAGTGKAASRG